MLIKISYLAAWIVLAGVAGLTFAKLQELIANHVGGAVAFLLLSAIQATLVALPFGSIWFLTGVFFVEPCIALTIGMVGSNWVAVAVRRLLSRRLSLAEVHQKIFILGMVDPGAQRIVRAMQTAFKINSVIGMLAFIAIYFAYEPQMAANMMLWFVLYTLPIGIIVIGNMMNLFFIMLPFIDERLRVQLFKDAAIALLPVLMAIVLVVYLLHPALLDAHITLFGRSVPSLATMPVLAFAFFLLLVVWPYIAGVRAGRNARVDLLRRDKDAASALTDAIFSGYWDAAALPLEGALSRMERQRDALEARHEVIGQAERLRETIFEAAPGSSVPTPPPVSREQFEDYLGSDLRIRSHAFVCESIANLKFTLETNGKDHQPVVKRQVMDHMALHAIRAIGSFTDDLVDVETARPRTFALFLTLGSIGSFALSVAGKVLLEVVFKAVAHF